MFDFLWTKNRIPLAVKKNEALKVVPLVWSEHCIECAAPVCYSTCNRYKRRIDGNCIRIVDAISPVGNYVNTNTQIYFRSWAKIESPYSNKLVCAETIYRLSKVFAVGDALFRSLSSLCFTIHVSKIGKFICNGWYGLRLRIVKHILKGKPQARVLALVGTINYQGENNTSLMVDIKSNTRLISRHGMEIKSGRNNFSVPIPSIAEDDEEKYINIHPSDPEAEFMILIDSLDLIDLDTSLPKIKCLIWDLDNTLWDGVLIEDKNVKLKKEFVELIKQLDKKGIVHSISSKNNFEDAMAKLKEYGIDEYFVFPKINWNPKGANITQTIKQLNIKPDTIVFIDDNPFERSQVSEIVEKITCIDPRELIEYTKSSRFDVIVNEDSIKRRSTYKMLEQMKQEEEEWAGDIDNFLLSCKLEVTLQKPTSSTIDRCFELLQRTNQLNASGRRLTRNEVEKIVSFPEDYMSIVINAKDKFGNYGVVGFIIVEIKNKKVSDFVMSCRVANRKIEPSVIDYISEKYFGGSISMVYVPTSKNTPMRQIITDLNMQEINANEFSYSYKQQNKVLTIIDEIE